MTVRSAMTANQITAEILIQVPRAFPFIRVWRNNRIEATVTGRGGRLRHVSAGIDGQGDITGILGLAPGVLACPYCKRRTDGKRIEIEIKAGADRLRPSQIAFREMILSAGGIYIESRSAESCLADLARVVGEG